MDDLWYDDQGRVKGVRIPNFDEEPSDAAINWLHKKVTDIPGFDFDGDGSGIILFCGKMQDEATGGEWLVVLPSKVSVYALPEDTSGPPEDEKYMSRCMIWKAV